MKTITLTFISDSGHGWLAVPAVLYRESGIKASHFSYQNKKTGMVYLEEDCDAELFYQAMQSKFNAVVEVREEYHDGQSIIRNMERMEQ